MIEKMVFLQGFGFGGTNSFGTLLNSLEQQGVFAYVLPFLIVFAIVFGVLTRVNIFGTDNKVINSIIALSVSLMAIQFGFVSNFFSEIFPRVGIGLGALLIILIIYGIANPEGNWNKGVLGIIGAIILYMIFYNTFEADFFTTTYWFTDNWPTIIVIIAVLFAVGAIISNTPKGQPFKFGKVLENLFSSSAYNSNSGNKP
jgi:hypothetical protein